MRAGKNPSVSQKKAMAKAGLNPDLWLVQEHNTKDGTIVICHRETGATKIIKERRR